MEIEKQNHEYGIWLFKGLIDRLSPEALLEYFGSDGLIMLSLCNKELYSLVSKKLRGKSKSSSIYLTCFKTGNIDLAIKLKKENIFSWDERKVKFSDYTCVLFYSFTEIQKIVEEFFPFLKPCIWELPIFNIHTEDTHFYGLDYLKKCFETKSESNEKHSLDLIAQAFYMVSLDEKNDSLILEYLELLSKNYQYNTILVYILSGYGLRGDFIAFNDFWTTNEKNLSNLINEFPLDHYTLNTALFSSIVVGGNTEIISFNIDTNLDLYQKYGKHCDKHWYLLTLSGHWEFLQKVGPGRVLQFDNWFLFFAPIQKSKESFKLILSVFGQSERLFPCKISEKDKLLYKEFYSTISLEFIQVLKRIFIISLESIVRILYLENPEKLEIVNAMLDYIIIEEQCSFEIGKGKKKYLEQIRKVFPSITDRINDILYPDVRL